MKMKYYNDDKQSGIIYDYNLVNKEFKKLHIPDDVYNPVGINFKNDVKYYMLLSERSRGKSTNILLYGMIMNKLYGTTIVYIRQRDDMIAKKNSINLFNVILDFDYVSKITDGKYKSIHYHSSRWFYCNYGDDGKPEEIEEEPFMIMLSIQSAQTYKSTLNIPYGDFIIYDEMISNIYFHDEFIIFMDLLKTIVRDRLSPIVILASNMVDRESPYMREFQIYDEIITMNQGDCRTVVTPKGTKIYVEILESVERNSRKVANSGLFFGFKNPKLIGITGGDWVIDSYRHIPKIRHLNELTRIYLEYNDALLQLRVVESLDDEMSGVYLFIEPSEKIELEENDIRLTFKPRRINDFYKLGEYEPSIKKVINLIIQGRDMYKDNTCASQMKNYIKLCK